FALAAFYAAGRRWWPAVFPLLALSVAVKPVLVLLAPLLLIYMLRRERLRSGQVALSLALAALVSALLYGPFYHGLDQIAGLSRESDHVTSSPGALIHTTLWKLTRANGVHLLAGMKLLAWPPC